MEATPAAAFKVTEPHLLLEFLVITFDAPAQFGEIDEPLDVDLRRERRQPILCRLLFAFGPLDQQPFLLQGCRIDPCMPGANTHTREARPQPISRTFSPLDRLPRTLRQ